MKPRDQYHLARGWTSYHLMRHLARFWFRLPMQSFKPVNLGHVSRAPRILLVGSIVPEIDGADVANRYPDFEFQFLFPSLRDYVGADAVLEVWNPYKESRKVRLYRTIKFLMDKRITHFVIIDVNAFGFDFFVLLVSFLIGAFSRVHKVVLSTDLLSASGIVLACLQAGKAGVIFAGTHPERIGTSLFGPHAPYFGSVDWSMFCHPEEMRVKQNAVPYSTRSINVLGPGNRYGSRAGLLAEIDANVRPSGSIFYPDKATTPYAAYMRFLGDSKIVLSTSLVQDQALRRSSFLVHDEAYVRHVNTRTFEGMLMGACVLVQECDALIEVIGDPGVHFLTFSDGKDAARQISYLLSPEGSSFARLVANNGRELALKKVRENFFWRRINEALVDRSLIPLPESQGETNAPSARCD